MLVWFPVEQLVNGSEIEDRLETEIDPRPPRSFNSRRTQVLSVRTDGFQTVTHNHPDGTTSNERVGGEFDLFLCLADYLSDHRLAIGKYLHSDIGMKHEQSIQFVPNYRVGLLPVPIGR
jgi:hypothetical protein